MDCERIKDFTRRIANSNRSALVVIKFEILFCYLDEAKHAKQMNQREEYKSAIRNADQVLKSFQETLDFKYDLSSQLYVLYVYCREQLSQAMYSFNEIGILNTKNVLKGLYEAFGEIAKQDQSKPLMQNTQQVFAGITYGKSQINENFAQMDTNRGFFI